MLKRTTQTKEIPLDRIKIGKRHRKNMGDTESLAASIEAVGLLHPIVIHKDGRLVAGARRIRAFKLLGRKTIPATIVDLAEIVRGESDENFERQDFTLSEAVSIKRAIEPLIKKEAKARQVEGGKLKGKASANLARAKGTARDIVAKRTGKARTSLAKAEELVRAREADPGNEFLAKLLEDMDRTGSVNGPHSRLKVSQQSAIIRAEPPPLPMNGPYRVIVADPPWPYEVRQEDPTSRAVRPYPSMTIANICAMPVASLAHKDCILWLWTTNNHMREAFAVLDAWGFEHRTILTWVKDKFGFGEWLRCQTEHCIMAVRGKPIMQLRTGVTVTTVLYGKVRAHSQKPEEFYTLVEKLCPAPRYCGLFERQQREGWDMHGDELAVRHA
jgi:N6-adenosine-specific RNA methylase IME4/ParB-like chromosome segregation protein Spo0J